MSKSNEDIEMIRNVVTKVGEYRLRNTICLFNIDGIIYTWTDLGSDQRFVEWRYGRWVLGYGGEDFEEYVMSTLENGRISIEDYIAENYTIPENCNGNTVTYLADKCLKTISCGGTWSQVQRFLDNKIRYLEENPRGPDGKRARVYGGGEY